MTTFHCRTRDASGAVVESTLAASSEREALAALEARGLVPIRIRPVSHAVLEPTQRPARRVERLDTKQLQQFSMQLGSSLRAGVPILRALRSIGASSSSKALTSIVALMVRDIEGGLPISEAMQRHPRAFPELYARTVAAGERTGSLDDVLFQLCDHLDAELELRAQIRSALTYPALVAGILCFAVAVLTTFVIPRFTVFYTGMHSELPLPTRVLLTGTTFVATNGVWLASLLTVVTFWGLRYARSPGGKERIDRALLRLPVVGRMLEAAITVRVVQMLVVTVNAGVPLLEGLQVMGNSTSNAGYKQRLREVVERIGHGETLGDSLEAAQCFHTTSRQMLASGEASGALGAACEALTRHLQRDLRALTKDFAVLIEPLMTVVIAAFVLFVALAAFLPIWNMTRLAA